MDDRKERCRINISISKELDDNISYISKKYGITKSSLCAFWLAQGSVATMKAWEALDKLPEKMVMKEGGDD